MRVLLAFLFCLPALRGQAERFLTAEEALRLCFPKAQRFETLTLELRRDELKAIESETKQRIRKNEIKLWLALPYGVLMADQVIGKHDFIDYAVAISTNGSVKQVEILEYREHYGGQVRQPKWREQLQGKTVRDRIKLGGDIYNITGATLSCRHVTEGVKKLLLVFDLVVRPRMLDNRVRAQP